MTPAPKAFVSHASEDKARFVMRFAERLRAAGIEVWLDRWEMLPGDSVVDRLFSEGIARADAVVFVLSRHSVDKPWVREEINAAFVRRVAGQTRLVPVLLDDCTVPAALATTLWERIHDLAHYDASFERIVAAITGVRDAPPPGPLADWALAPTVEVPGLSALDARVLQALGAILVRQGHGIVDGEELAAAPDLAGLPESELSDALDMLADAGCVTLDRTAPGWPLVTMTDDGIERWSQAALPDHAAFARGVAAAIVNDGLASNDAIAGRLGQPRWRVDHVLARLAARNLIELAQYGSGLKEVGAASAALRRSLAT